MSRKGGSLRRLAAGCLLGLMIVWSGCGGDEDRLASKEEIARAKEQRKKQQAKDAEAAQKARATKAQTAAKKAAEYEQKRQEQLAERQKRKEQRTRPVDRRPDNFTTWSKRDYYEAKAEGDRRMINAIEHLGRAFPGDTHAADLLSDLLQPGLPAGFVSSHPVSRVQSSRTKASAVERAVVLALIENGSDSAWQTIDAVVSGQASTLDSLEMLRDTILTTLANLPNPRSEPIFLKALLSPLEIASDTKRNRTDAQVKKRLDLAREAMTKGASSSFRLALAQRLARGEGPVELQLGLRSLLTEPWPENLPAQVMLLQDARLDAPVRIDLETQWAAYGSETLRRLLSQTEGPTMSSVSPPPSSPLRRTGRNDSRLARATEAAAADMGLAPRVMQHLWAKPVTTLVEDQLYRAGSLDEQATVILLASTIPSDAIRRQLHGALSRNWQDGPDALEETGAFDKVACEPGAWVALKDCFLAHQPSRRARVDRRMTANGKNQTEGPDPQAQWHAAVGRRLLSLCRYLEEAATLRWTQALRSGVSRDDRKSFELPISMHDEAHLVARLRLDWPAQASAPSGAPGPSPTRLWYARCVETGVLAQLVAHYRSRMESEQEFSGPQGTWLTELGPAGTPGNVRSIDVLIQRTAELTSDTVAARSKEEKLIIEILVVEIRDPTERSDRLAHRL
ncbi:MAG: hypothetical protein JW818_11310 [Pirellulales bacterium]|nr:hypothetical protein [Pirellulales bacterium]